MERLWRLEGVGCSASPPMSLFRLNAGVGSWRRVTSRDWLRAHYIHGVAR
jgi:hypothetical protein